MVLAVAVASGRGWCRSGDLPSEAAGQNPYLRSVVGVSESPAVGRRAAAGTVVASLVGWPLFVDYLRGMRISLSTVRWHLVLEVLPVVGL